MSIYTFCVLGWVVLFVADVESFDTIGMISDFILYKPYSKTILSLIYIKVRDY